jgi:hypothetical protein
VRSLNLERGIRADLEANLNTTQRIFADSNAKNDGAAIDALRAFIHSAEAQRGKKIAEADADMRIAMAQQVVAQVSAG